MARENQEQDKSSLQDDKQENKKRSSELTSTYLQLVEAVDSWPYFTKDPVAYRQHMKKYHYFLIDGYDKPFGYIHNNFVNQLVWPSFWNIDSEKRSLTLTQGFDFATRTELMDQTLRQNHDFQKASIFPGWANEKFPVYSDTGDHVLDMDGCGVEPFGIINYSVHMIGWVMTAEGIKIWVPRRAWTKSTFPGQLDNTVGGCLASGETPLEGIVRECQEEICLDPEYTRSNIRACGTLSFQLDVTDSLEPGCQHQVQYLYELEMRQDIVPRIGDGEVGELYLKSLDQVQEAMRDGEFKPSCNMTYLAFLVRHGYVTAENEPDIIEICSRMHRRHDLFMVC